MPSQFLRSLLNTIGNMSIRRKLTGALLVITALNTAYFTFGIRSISEMNGIILSLYDKVVMSSTYSLMVKNDFARYSENVSSILLAENDERRNAKVNELADSASGFDDDLKVVQTRALSKTDSTDATEIRELFTQIQKNADLVLKNAKAANSPQVTLSLSREWQQNPKRLEILQRLSDFADRVIADGYTFRLQSVERTNLIQELSIISAIGVLIINALLLLLILLAILPPLKKLSRLCGEIANGVFSKRVDITYKDELGTLAKSFNEMLDILDQRERELRDQLLVTAAMVNSLGQGFLMVDKNGLCLDVYSKACETLLLIKPAHRELADVLRVPPEARDEFKDWLEIVFSELLSFADAAALGPATFQHDEADRSISIAYKAIRDGDGKIQNLIVIATDLTSEKKAKDLAEKEVAFSKLLSNLVKNPTEFRRYISVTKQMIEDLGTADVSRAKLLLHTIKGSAATFSMLPLKKRAHASEDLLNAPNANKNSLHEQLVTLKAELAVELSGILSDLQRTVAFNIDAQQGIVEVDNSSIETFYRELTTYKASPVLIQHFSDGFLNVPIQQFFQMHESAVSELGARLGKPVESLRFVGGNLRVNRNAYTEIFARLIHLFRNAVDHGIEMPEIRAKRGKPASANIQVEFSQISAAEGAELQIKVTDDGGGIDPNIIRSKLIERGIASDGESDDKIIQHVFDEDFSTARQVTDISGRGVGLSAVRAEVEKVGGKILVNSQPGVGCRFEITLPQIHVS